MSSGFMEKFATFRKNILKNIEYVVRFRATPWRAVHNIGRDAKKLARTKRSASGVAGFKAWYD